MPLERIIVALAFIFFSFNALAAGQQMNPKGVKGHVGAGYSAYKITEPAKNFKLDQGQFATLGGEKGFGILNSYLTFNFNYMSAEGLSNYSYTTLAGDVYDANDVKFGMNVMQAGIGLKVKIIDGFFIQPYVEGGGVFGYYTLEFKPSATQKADLDADASARKEYKTKDSLLDFGNYGEAGAELVFSPSFALKIAGRLQTSQTKEFDTLNKSKVSYVSEIYYLTLLKAF